MNIKIQMIPPLTPERTIFGKLRLAVRICVSVQSKKVRSRVSLLRSILIKSTSLEVT